MPRVQHTTRALLLAMGMGDFNATQCIQTMMLAPHTTDPDMPPVILLTRAIQENLNRIGAGLEVTSQIDQPTDDILYRLCGEGYLTRPWYAIVEAVLSAQNRGVQVNREQPELGVPAQPLSDYVPAPENLIKYAAIGAVAWWFLFKKKRR